MFLLRIRSRRLYLCNSEIATNHATKYYCSVRKHFVWNIFIKNMQAKVMVKLELYYLDVIGTECKLCMLYVIPCCVYIQLSHQQTISQNQTIWLLLFALKVLLWIPVKKKWWFVHRWPCRLRLFSTKKQSWRKRSRPTCVFTLLATWWLCVFAGEVFERDGCFGV